MHWKLLIAVGGSDGSTEIWDTQDNKIEYVNGTTEGGEFLLRQFDCINTQFMNQVTGSIIYIVYTVDM